MEKLSDKLLKQIRENSSKDELFYAGLSQEMEIQNLELSSDASASVFRTLESIFYGAESDTVDGLRLRIKRLNELRQYLLSTNSISPSEQKIIFPIFIKIEKSINNHISAKKSKLETLKKSLSNMIESDTVVAAFGNNIVAQLAFDGMRKIKQKREQKKELQKEEKMQLKADKESSYKTELSKEKDELQKQDSEKIGTSFNTVTEKSNLNNSRLESGMLNEPEVNYNTENSSSFGGSGAFDIISGMDGFLKNMNPSNQNSTGIEEWLNLIVDKLKPLDEISKDMKSLVSTSKKQEKNILEDAEYKEQMMIAQKTQDRLLQESLLEKVGGGDIVGAVSNISNNSNVNTRSGANSRGMASSILSMLGPSIATMIGPILLQTLGVGMIVAGIGKAIYDGFQGFLKSGEWGVSGVSAALGGFFAGTGSGLTNAFANAGKWALVGAGVGLVGGPFGVVAGGIMGAILGGILGFVGGEKLARMFDSVWSWASDTAEIAMMKFGNFFSEMWDGFIDLIKDAFDFVLDLFSNAKILYIKGLKGILDGIISVLPTKVLGVKVPGAESLQDFSKALGDLINQEEGAIKARKEASDNRNKTKEEQKAKNRKDVQDTKDRQAKEFDEKQQKWEEVDAKKAEEKANKKESDAKLISGPVLEQTYIEEDSQVNNKLMQDKNIPDSGNLGMLSEKYESGGRGSSAVGYDSTGGTSYGKYQIATKTGTMNQFMNYLKESNPAAYQRLSAAGPADSGKNGKFAQEWKALASEGVLGTSEHDFIKKTHFDVGMKGIKNESLQKMLQGNKALQEVMWSTSVQHGGGGASSIFNKAFKEGMSEQDLIKAVYDSRSTKFGSSTQAVRNSVMNRFGNEEKVALAMLKDQKTLNNEKAIQDQVMLASNDIIQQKNIDNYNKVNASGNMNSQNQGQVVNVNNVNNSKNVQNNNSTQSSGEGMESHGTSSRTESFMRSLMA